MDRQKTAQYIHRLRKENHMTQKELAEKIYVTDKAVSKWERGLGSPDISILPLLADAFGVTADDILHGGCDMRQDHADMTIPVETSDAKEDHGESAEHPVSFFKKKHVRILCLPPIVLACIFGVIAILYLISALMYGQPFMPAVFVGLFIPWFILSSITGFIPLLLCYVWHRMAAK